MASGISENCRLDIASIIGYSAGIHLDVESVESLDLDFVTTQVTKLSKLLRILERDLFHYLQIRFAEFVEESFEFAQLAAFWKTKDR